jgi:hypothetical protein
MPLFNSAQTSKRIIGGMGQLQVMIRSLACHAKCRDISTTDLMMVR